MVTSLSPTPLLHPCSKIVFENKVRVNAKTNGQVKIIDNRLLG